MKKYILTLLALLLSLSLTGCFLNVESYAFDISNITQVQVVSINQSDRTQDEVLQSYDNLTDDDQLVIDINLLLNQYTYKVWEDYRKQQGDAKIEVIQSVVVIVYTESESYMFGRSTNSFVHLDHRDAEDKAMMFSDDLTPLRVIDNVFYTELILLFGIQ